jgi:hypothetical protein
MPQKRKMETDDVVKDVVTRLRRGDVSILEAVATELPAVFAAEILPKLRDLRDTLNLARVNKACNEAVWSPDCVSSMPDKIKGHLYSKHGKHDPCYPERPPMHFAAWHGNVPAVRALLKAGVGINACASLDALGYTAFHVAILGSEQRGVDDRRGHLNMVKFLIEAGANVNHATPQHETPLYYAAEKGDARILMELIKAGADLDWVARTFKRGWDDSPINRAARSGHTTCVALLIQAGADFNLANEKGQAPLYFAVKRGYAEIEGLLRCAGASDDFSEVDFSESEDDDEDDDEDEDDHDDEDDEAVDEDEDDHDADGGYDGDDPTGAFDGVTSFSQLYSYPNLPS